MIKLITLNTSKQFRTTFIHTSYLILTIQLISCAEGTLTDIIGPTSSTELEEYTAPNTNNCNESNQTTRLPFDTYLISNQRGCYKSQSLLSCIKFRAAKFIWSLATNRFNYFDSSTNAAKSLNNENSLMDVRRSMDNNDNTTTSKRNNMQMKFVYLNAPSDLQLFQETRTFQGDGEFSRAIKFVKRAIQTFVQSHGLQVQLDSLGGLQVLNGGKNFITGRGPHKEMKKRLKFAILLPIIILLKLFHLKMTVIPLLFLMNGLNLILIAGGTYIVYYLKHHTICKIKPHIMETHSHVWDQIPAESRGHKKVKKKLKWLILFPLIILGKIASLKMSMVVLMFTVIGAQLALAGGFAFIIYWLKHTYLCKINPKLAETVSGPTWDQDSDYSSFAYPGAESGPYSLSSKDWASSKAYNAYNYLDTISRPL